jgi:hypothetical protein
MTDEPHADRVLRVAKAMAWKLGYRWGVVPEIWRRDYCGPTQGQCIAMAEAAIAELEKKPC